MLTMKDGKKGLITETEYHSFKQCFSAFRDAANFARKTAQENANVVILKFHHQFNQWEVEYVDPAYKYWLRTGGPAERRLLETEPDYRWSENEAIQDIPDP